MTINTGFALALIGAALATFLPGIGSSIGVGGAARAAAGVTGEDPKKFGKLLVLQLLPASQALYGLLCAVFVFLKIGLLPGGAMQLAEVTPSAGYTLLFLCLPIAVVGCISAIMQGKVCVSGIALISKRPDQSGKCILMATMVEVFALFALLVSLLGILSLT